MAKIIEFYVPTRFKRARKWIPAEQYGRLLLFVRSSRTPGINGQRILGTPPTRGRVAAAAGAHV